MKFTSYWAQMKTEKMYFSKLVLLSPIGAFKRKRFAILYIWKKHGGLEAMQLALGYSFDSKGQKYVVKVLVWREKSTVLCQYEKYKLKYSAKIKPETAEVVMKMNSLDPYVLTWYVSINFPLISLVYANYPNVYFKSNKMLVCIFVARDTVQQLPAVLVDDVGYGQEDSHPAHEDHGEAEPVHVKITCLK